MLRTAVTVLALAAAAQAQVVQTKKGPVEFIGLEDWTPAALQAKLGYTSDDPHYCAADLRAAGFPAASVNLYINDDKSWYTVVSLVEPKHAAAISTRPAPASREWSPDRDRDWYDLVACLRAPDDRVSSKCGSVLDAWTRRSPHTIDWKPAVDDLGAVLRGTNLFHYMTVVRMLTATKVAPSLAPEILNLDAMRLLTAFRNAQHPPEREAAVALLEQLGIARDTLW